MTAPAEHPTAVEADGIPPLRFVVPEGFHALPISASADQLDTALDEFVHEVFPLGDTALWKSVAPYYRQVTELMATAGLAYSSFGIFGTEGSGVAHCSLTVTAVESSHTDPEVAAQGIVATLENDPYNDARWLELPCGPAVTCVTLREHALVDEDIPSGDEQPKLLTGQIQVYVPFPNGPYSAVFTVNTASMEYWSEFCNMITAVLQTVTFPSQRDA